MSDSKKRELMPDPPGHLDPIAQSVYQDVCAILHSADLLTTADLFVVEMFADAYAQWVAAIQVRDDYRASYQTAKPEHIRLCRDLAADINRWCKVLGFGPLHRQKLSAAFGFGGEQTNDELDDPVILGICG